MQHVQHVFGARKINSSTRFKQKQKKSQQNAKQIYRNGAPMPNLFHYIFWRRSNPLFFFSRIRRWHPIFRLSTIHSAQWTKNKKSFSPNAVHIIIFFVLFAEFGHIAAAVATAAAAYDYFICKFSRQSIYWNNQMTNVTPIGFMNIQFEAIAHFRCDAEYLRADYYRQQNQMRCIGNGGCRGFEKSKSKWKNASQISQRLWRTHSRPRSNPHRAFIPMPEWHFNSTNGCPVKYSWDEKCEFNKFQLQLKGRCFSSAHFIPSMGCKFPNLFEAIKARLPFKPELGN